MKLAVIGDIHGFWDARDTAYFNASDYRGLLFVGDIPRWTRGQAVVRELARLTKPAWLIPGNHDAVTLPQLLAELKGWPLLPTLTAIGMGGRARRLARRLRPVRMVGYHVETLGADLGLLSARPHAMGPDKFYFRAYLRRRFGIADYDDSARLLKQLVDSAPRDLLVLAHNGPRGLGGEVDAPWGCDFAPKPEYGDFGDPDLRAAIDYARAGGRRVVALVAGHMHHRGKHSGQLRRSWAWDGDTLCINAAAVARIRAGGSRRHHVALDIDNGSVRAETMIVDAAGELVERLPIGETLD